VIPHPAQYLLRFDDLCPTMAHDRWQRFLPLIEEFGLRPILAVIPDNRDEELNLAPPDAEFWARMRAMEAAGATIGLHGYRHLCELWGRSLLPPHAQTEFAGAPEETQRAWICEGLGILEFLSPRATASTAPPSARSARRESNCSRTALHAFLLLAAPSPGFRSSFGGRWRNQRDCGPSASTATLPATLK
jgi:hypothetical protein